MMVAQVRPSDDEVREFAQLAGNPVWFCRSILGHDPWLMPRRIMRALDQHHVRVAVKACHSSGKTFSAAEMVLWWVYIKRGIVITTAPTWHQVEMLLWNEVRLAHGDARLPLGGEILQTEIKLSPNNYAVGLSTNKGVRFQGFHGNPLLVVIDEAPGVAPDIWEAIEGIRAGGDVRILALGNPTIASGPFYDAFTTQREGWTTFTIDAFATPNFTDDLSRPMTLDELRSLDDAGLDYAPRPYLTRRRWVAEKLRDWGEQSPLWASRVRGQFPDQSEDALISLAWLERATGIPDGIAIPADAPLVGGIDVAGPGEDETVLHLRTADGQPSIALPLHAWAIPDARGPVVAELAKVRSRLVNVNVDAIGIGYNFALHLRDLGFPVTLVNVGERPTHAGDTRYANLKAQLYWTLREALANGELVGLSDDVQVSQLASVRYQQDSRGHVVIERKEQARKRGVRSPDRAEALMLSYATGTSSGPAATAEDIRLAALGGYAADPFGVDWSDL